MTACSNALEYLNLVRDTLYLGRNVIIGRSFQLINKDAIESFSKRYGVMWATSLPFRFHPLPLLTRVLNAFVC